MNSACTQGALARKDWFNSVRAVPRVNAREGQVRLGVGWAVAEKSAS